MYKEKKYKMIVPILVYGAIYSLAEYISAIFEKPHSITAVVSLLFLIGILGFLWSENKLIRYRIWSPENMNTAVCLTVPLLFLPICNIAIYNSSFETITVPVFILSITESFLEEILFRGVMPVQLNSVFNSKASKYIFISLFFAILHIDTSMGVVSIITKELYCFFVGFTFLALTERTSSILPASVIHILINLSALYGCAETLAKSIMWIIISLISAVYGLYIIRSESI